MSLPKAARLKKNRLPLLSLSSLNTNKAVRTINDLKAGETAQIETFSDESCALRLLSLGVLPQSIVTLVRRSPLGDALYLRVGSQHIAIRSLEARTITLQA